MSTADATHHSSRRASGIPRIDSSNKSCRDNRLRESSSSVNKGEEIDMTQRIPSSSSVQSVPTCSNSSTSQQFQSSSSSSSSSSSTSFSSKLCMQNLYTDITAHSFDDSDVFNLHVSTKEGPFKEEDIALEQFYGDGSPSQFYLRRGMTVHNSVSNSHDDYKDDAFHSSNSNSIGRKLFTESSLSPSSSFSPSFDIAEGFFKDGRKVHIAHLSEAASRSWRFYLDHLIAAVEHFTATTNWGKIWEYNDNTDQYIDVCSDGSSNILSVIFQEHVKDRWNLEYLEALSAEYFRLGFVSLLDDELNDEWDDIISFR